MIKDISTKDGRINIYINYIFLIRKNKPLITKYSSLVLGNNFSINYIAHKLKMRPRLLKIKDPNIYSLNNENVYNQKNEIINNKYNNYQI